MIGRHPWAHLPNVVSLDEARAPAGRPEPRRLKPYYPSTMDDRPPPPRWLVDGVVMEGMVCLVTGAPGVGKSLALQQLLTAAALGGVDWLGLATEPVTAFGLFCEDPSVFLQRRQWDICEYYGRSPGDLEGRIGWDCGESAQNALWDRGRPTSLWREMWDAVASDGVSLLAIDTAAAVFRGNENDRAQVTAFMEALAGEAARRRVAVLLSAHPSRGNQDHSGSTAWLGSCRFAVSMRRHPEAAGIDDPRRQLVGLKANYSAGLRARNFRYDRGVFVPDGAAEASGGASARLPLTQLDKLELDNRLVDGMRRVRRDGGDIPADVLKPYSAPWRAKRSGDPGLAAVSLNALYDAQERLLTGGRLVRVMVRGRVMVRPADAMPYQDEVAPPA